MQVRTCGMIKITTTLHLYVIQASSQNGGLSIPGQIAHDMLKPALETTYMTRAPHLARPRMGMSASLLGPTSAQAQGKRRSTTGQEQTNAKADKDKPRYPLDPLDWPNADQRTGWKTCCYFYSHMFPFP